MSLGLETQLLVMIKLDQRKWSVLNVIQMLVTKALMSPRIPKKGSSNNQENTVLSNGRNNNLNDAIRKIRDEIKKNSEYVGKEFPEEARKIHYHESEERSIYGEATAKDIKELHEEGIDIIHIPNLPDDKN